MLIITTTWLVWLCFSIPNPISIIEDNLEISLTMIAGSIIAGATSTGGGAIAFPVFTKILEIPATEARIFSLAIQSIGMNAAVVMILVLGITIEWAFVFWGSIGGIVGIIAGTLLADSIPPEVVKILFTATVVSLAVTLLVKPTSKKLLPSTYESEPKLQSHANRKTITMITAGLFGGVISGLIGNGIDVVCFSAMVLLFGQSEKIATPTAVVLMAFNAAIGFAFHILFLRDFTPEIREYWLASIPIVIVGAPIGVIICNRMSSPSIRNILVSLIFIELLSSLWLIPFSIRNSLVGLGAFLVGFTFFQLMTKKRELKQKELQRMNPTADSTQPFQATRPC